MTMKEKHEGGFGEVMEPFWILVIAVVTQTCKYINVHRTEHQGKSMSVYDDFKNKNPVKANISIFVCGVQFIVNFIFPSLMTLSFNQLCLHD